MQVFISEMLPIHEMTKACDIETKEEINVYTGKIIHCTKLGGDLFVSNELYIALLKKPSELTPYYSNVEKGITCFCTYHVTLSGKRVKVKECSNCKRVSQAIENREVGNYIK